MSDSEMFSKDSQFTESFSSGGGKVKMSEAKKKSVKEGRWTNEEHEFFLQEVLKIGIKNWKKGSQLESRIKTRDNCQIRSHFQKYLKKICLKHNLTKSLSEVFLTPEMHELLRITNPVDLQIIEIFNSYKKMRNSTRRRKMKIYYKKHLAKKKFFKVKKPSDTPQVLKLPEASASTSNDPNISKDRKEKKEESAKSKDSSNSHSSTASSIDQEKLTLLTKLIEIQKMNQRFLQFSTSAPTYDYNTCLHLLQNFCSYLPRKEN